MRARVRHMPRVRFIPIHKKHWRSAKRQITSLYSAGGRSDAALVNEFSALATAQMSAFAAEILPFVIPAIDMVFIKPVLRCPGERDIKASSNLIPNGMGEA